MRYARVLLLTVICPLALSAQRPPIWRLSPTPILQIGVVDGDSAYMFHNVASALRLPDGRIAVMNEGSHQLRLYDATGKLIVSKGRRGGGPGEFFRPGRIYQLGADSLMVYDRGNARFSIHRTNGDFVRVQPGAPYSIRREGPGAMAQSEFPTDEWLYNRSWIDGPPLGKGRGPVRAAIDRLPPPDAAAGYRYIIVSPQEHLWVRGPVRPNARVEWSVYDLDARPLGRVTLPARFTLFQIGRDFILGVARDELDIEYVQLLRLEGAPATTTRRLASADTLRASPRRAVAPELLTRMQAALRDISMQQEIFYSQPKNSYTYANDAKQFDRWEAPKDLVIRIVNASTLGWMALVIDPVTGVTCGIGMGAPSFVPMGWTMGRVTCE
jgi:hypothetical protein